MPYTPELKELIKRVEKTRPARVERKRRGEEFTALSLEERRDILKYHPDFKEEGRTEILVGPSKGYRIAKEMVDLLHAKSRLDPDKIDSYLETVPALAALSPRESLLRRGCLTGRRGNYPTVAGILLFAKDVERFLTNDMIVVRYAGREMSDEFIREDIRGTLPEQVRRAESAVLANLRTGARISSLRREDQLESPPRAVREAIVNAVAHRDYGVHGDGIRISIFSDRMEFYSPGRLPGHVTVENIADERFSRNAVLVQVLSDMGFIERLGYGIDRMIRWMAEAGLPLPQFRETANGFLVTLYGPGEDFRSERGSARRRWSVMGLNERQMQALEYLSEHGRITNREYQELCPDVSSETIRRDLANLVERDLLLKIGDKRATYYIFKQQA